MPMYLSTTDDTTLFCFEGAVESKKTKFIIKKNTNGTRSAYTKDGPSTDSLRGLRIRHSITFNAVGNATPFYATVYGLNEDELPSSSTPNGVYTLPVQGFCYGGSQDCGNKSVGYIVFLRSSKQEDEISTDQINHEQYRNNIFLPYVAKTREFYQQSEGWEEGDPVDDDNLWVGWQVCFCINICHSVM